MRATNIMRATTMMKATTKTALARANFQMKSEYILEGSPQVVYEHFFSHPNAFKKWVDAAGSISMVWPDNVDPCTIGTIIHQEADNESGNHYATAKKQVVQWNAPSGDKPGVIEFTYILMNTKAIPIQVANSSFESFLLEGTGDGKTKVIFERLIDLNFFGRMLSGTIRTNNQAKLDLIFTKLQRLVKEL